MFLVREPKLNIWLWMVCLSCVVCVWCPLDGCNALIGQRWTVTRKLYSTCVHTALETTYSGINLNSRIKLGLAKLANIHLGQLWLNSSLKEKIVIGRHSLESSGAGAAHFRRYQNRFTGRYDGVHLYGQTGHTDYTNSIKTILSLALPKSHPNYFAPKFNQLKVKVDNHTNCPQAIYHRCKYPHLDGQQVRAPGWSAGAHRLAWKLLVSLSPTPAQTQLNSIWAWLR